MTFANFSSIPPETRNPKPETRNPESGIRNPEPGTLLLRHIQELLGALGDEVLKLRFLVVFEFSG